MEVQRVAQAAFDAAWESVRKNRLLRGEAKLAWHYLWRIAGGKPGTVTTSAADVGSDQGGDRRNGLFALESLEVGGWIEVLDCPASRRRPHGRRRDGAWVVYVVSPAELQTARRRPHDPQQDLGLDDGTAERRMEAAPPPPVGVLVTGRREAGENPAQVSPLLHLEKEKIFRSPSTSTSLNTSLSTSAAAEISRPGAAAGDFAAGLERELAARRAAAEREAERPIRAVRPIGQVLDPALAADLARLPAGDDESARIAAVADDIVRWVACPKLFRSVAEKAAQALVLGRLDGEELLEIRRRLEGLRRANQLTVSPSAYFVGALKRAFGRNGIAWERSDR